MSKSLSPQNVVCVVPAMNEASVIGEVVSQLVSRGFQVLVIDDGSVDGTYDLARAAGATVLRHLVNCGQGAAIETGFTAIRRGLINCNLVATFDADGQHSTDDLYAMLQEFNANPGLEVILGSRFLNGISNVPFGKKVLLKYAAFLAKFTLRIKVTDRHNGIRMFKRDILASICLSVPGYGHADEILTIIASEGLNYKEIPVQIRYSTYSKAKGQPMINSVRIVLDSVLLK